MNDYSWADALQREHAEWLRENFPGQEPLFPAVGMVEEAGELMHALLKLQQSARWGKEPRYARKDWTAAIRDGIGDCALYTVSLCNTQGWSYRRMLERADSLALVLPPLEYALRAVSAAALVVRQPSSEVLASGYSEMVHCLARSMGLDFKDPVLATWEVVSRRRRTDRPKPEVVVLCGSTRFRREYEAAFRREEHAGRVCLTVPCFKDDPCCKTDGEQSELDALHRAKIDMADTVLVIDVGGYIGDSTARELELARRLGKRVRRWSEEVKL